MRRLNQGSSIILPVGEDGNFCYLPERFSSREGLGKSQCDSVQSGYLIVGPTAILDRIHSETVRLSGLEKPHYEIVDTVPSIQNLRGMLEKMGLAVTVVIVDGRSMVIGPEDDVIQTVRIFQRLLRGVVCPRRGT